MCTEIMSKGAVNCKTHVIGVSLVFSLPASNVDAKGVSLL